MFETSQIESWQSNKKILLAVFWISLVLTATTALLRFERRINNAISGLPRPMKVITRKFAENMAAQTGRQFPVIVVNDESASWQKLKDTQIENQDDAFYVLSYSERAHSICIIAYVPIEGRIAGENVVTLRPGEGENYGRALTVPIQVVSAGRFVKDFTDAFISLMDWNKEFKLTDGMIATSSLRSVPASATEMSLDVSLNVFDLRAEVGRKHNSINHWLLVGLCIFVALAIFSAFLLWRIFKAFRRHCLAYNFDLTPRVYLLQDLRSINEQAQRAYCFRKRQMSQQMRVENLFRRSAEETATRLRSLLEIQPDSQRRSRIQECLDRGNLGEMNALWDEFHLEIGQRTPEERLALLLESLKEYCSEEELNNCRSEVSVILQAMGFRPARDFVVRMHDEFRIRAKEAEQNEATPDRKNSA